MRAKRCSLTSEYLFHPADNRTCQVRIDPSQFLPNKYNSMPSQPMSGNVRFCPVFSRRHRYFEPTSCSSTTYSSFSSCLRSARPDIRQSMSQNVPYPNIRDLQPPFPRQRPVTTSLTAMSHSNNRQKPVVCLFFVQLGVLVSSWCN